MEDQYANLDIDIVREVDKKIIEFKSMDSSYSKYEFGNREAFAIGFINIKKPGTYILNANYKDGGTKPEMILAVSKSLLTRIIVPVLISCFSMIAIFIALGRVFFKVYKQRSKQKKLQKVM